MAGLKILYITSEASVYNEDSPIFKQLKRCSALVEELHIIIVGRAPHLSEKQAGNLWVHPVTGGGFFGSGAAALGKKIVYDRKFVRGQSVIVTEDPLECGSAGLAIRRRWKLPLEIECKSSLSHLSFWQQRMAERVLRGASMVRVYSQDDAQSISRRFSLVPEKMLVRSPFIDCKGIEASRPAFDLHAQYPWRYIMLAAALRDSRDKHFEIAVEVLAKLRKYTPDVGLIILGAGSQARGLKAQAKALGVDGNMACIEAKEDYLSFFKTADMFIQTSTYESYGEELVIAGLCGLPIVTTLVGLAKELENGKESIICPIGDPEYMFKAVYDLMQNDGLRELLHIHIRPGIENKLASEEEDARTALEDWNRIAAMVSSSQ